MGINYSPKIVTNGLVLCLDAGNPLSYPPGSGTVWTDLSGNGNHGTLTNGPTFNSSNKGSIVFDGVDDYVPLSTTDGSVPTIRTVFIVFKRNGVQINGAVLLGKRTSGCFNTAIYVAQSSPTSSAALRAYRGGPELSLISPFIDNQWYSVAIVITSTTTDFYINGIYTTGYSSIFDNNQLLSNISSSCSAAAPFKGQISLIKAYSTELTADQIKQNYDAIRGRFNL